MEPVTRRQVLRAFCGGGALLGLGGLAACGQPDPRPTVGGAGRVAATPVGTDTPPTGLTPVVTIYPPRPTIDGTLVLPTAVPDPLGGTVVLKTPNPNLPVPNTSYPTRRPEDPFCSTLSPARDGTVQFCASVSELVVIATVTGIVPARWTTPDGKRPPDPGNGQYIIYTPIEIQVEQVLKGIAPTPLRILSNVGRIGVDCALIADNLVTFTTIGERVVLYLNPPKATDTRQPPDGPRWYITGRHTITADGQATNSYQSLPLTELLAIVASLSASPAPTSAPSPNTLPAATPTR